MSDFERGRAPGLLLTLGKARQLTTINLVSSAVMLVLLFALVPWWQEYGAALALVANFVLWTTPHGLVSESSAERALAS